MRTAENLLSVLEALEARFANQLLGVAVDASLAGSYVQADGPGGRYVVLCPDVLSLYGFASLLEGEDVFDSRGLRASPVDDGLWLLTTLSADGLSLAGEMRLMRETGDGLPQVWQAVGCLLDLEGSFVGGTAYARLLGDVRRRLQSFLWEPAAA